MLSSGAIRSLLPRYAALPPDSGTPAQRLINTQLLLGAGGNQYGLNGQPQLQQFLPELRLPVVTWDQPPMAYAGDVAVWLRDDPIIRHLGTYRDERTYEEMRTTITPVANSIKALVTQLLGVGYGLMAKRERRHMPAAKTLKTRAEHMIARMGADHLHSFLEIASAMLVFDGWLPVQTWWSPYSESGAGKQWGPDKIFEMPQQLFGVNPDRKLVWLGYSLTETRPQVLDGEADQLAWMYFSAGSTRSPYGRSDLRSLWLAGWIYKQVLELHVGGARNAMQGIPVLKEVGAAWMPPASAEKAALSGDAGSAAMTQAMKEAQRIMGYLKEYGVVIVRGGYDFKLETVNGYSDGWGKLLDLLKLELVLGVEGQHLTSSVGEHGGSRATADVQAQTKLDRVRNLARHIEAPVNEIIRRWIAVNFKEEPDPEDVPKWGFHLLDPIDIAKARAFMDYGGELDAEECASRWGDLPVSQAWIETGGVLKMQPKVAIPPGQDPQDAGSSDKALRGAAPDPREAKGVPDDSTAPSRQAQGAEAN